MANVRGGLAVVRRHVAPSDGDDTAVRCPECRDTTEAVNRPSKRIR
jgi:hypothetical protein